MGKDGLAWVLTGLGGLYRNGEKDAPQTHPHPDFIPSGRQPRQSWGGRRACGVRDLWALKGKISGDCEKQGRCRRSFKDSEQAVMRVTHAAGQTRDEREGKPHATQKARLKAEGRPRGIGSQSVGIHPNPKCQQHEATKKAPPELLLWGERPHNDCFWWPLGSGLSNLLNRHCQYGSIPTKKSKRSTKPLCSSW